MEENKKTVPENFLDAADTGRNVRKRNLVISIIFGVIFFGLLFWLIKSGNIDNTDQIRRIIEQGGIFSPLLFILFSVFTSYVPIVPMGSMGSIGIVLFGPFYAFWLNSITSIINCLLAYALARKFGNRIILWFASPETVNKYESWLEKSGHYQLFFTIAMFMPVSPDLVLCMLAGIMNMKFSHFLIIILLSRPFSSWCYSTGLLYVFDWLRKVFHL